MMHVLAHTRADVRQDVVTRLQASTVAPLSALAAAHIRDSSMVPIQTDEMVGINVYTSRQRDHDNLRRSTVSLTIECVSAVSLDSTTDLPSLWATAAELADSYAEAVTQTLLEDPTWESRYEPIGEMQTDCGWESEASVPRYVVRMQMDITWARPYQTRSSYYTTFGGMDVETDAIDPVDPSDPADGGIVGEAKIDV